MTSVPASDIRDAYTRFGTDRRVIMDCAKSFLTPIVVENNPDIHSTIDDIVGLFSTKPRQMAQIRTDAEVSLLSLANARLLPENLAHAVIAINPKAKGGANAAQILRESIDTVTLGDLQTLHFANSNRLILAAAIIVARALRTAAPVPKPIDQLTLPTNQRLEPGTLGQRRVFGNGSTHLNPDLIFQGRHMPQKSETMASHTGTSRIPLLERLFTALQQTEMRECLQHVLNGSPDGRTMLEDILFKAETTYNAPQIEAALRDIVPDGVNPYDYLGLDRDKFIKAVLEIPNPLPKWMNSGSPAEKLERSIETIDQQVKFFSELRSEFSALASKRKIVLHDFVGGKFDHYLSTEAWKGFQALRMGNAIVPRFNLFTDITTMGPEDFRAIRNVRGVGYNTMGEIVAFIVLARQTDNFKTLAAMPKPLGLDLPEGESPLLQNNP